MKKACLTAAMFGITALVIVGLLEFAFRWSGRLRVESNERIVVYQYDAELGWFGVPGAQAVYSDPIATIHVQNNSWGFRDREHGPKTKPRLVVLGDSFIWGFQVQAEERFTNRLQKMLPDWEVVNCGISGYGTDQEYLLARRFLPSVAPDLVLLMFCVGNDFFDNSANAVNKGYYKPYFTLEERRLVLRGVPVPKALAYSIQQHRFLFKSYILRRLASLYFQWRTPEFTNPYSPSRELISAIRKYSEQQGAGFMMGLTHRSPELEDFCSREGIPVVDVSTDLSYRRLGWHWTPEGNEFVAKKVYSFLTESQLLGAAPSGRDPQKQISR